MSYYIGVIGPSFSKSVTLESTQVKKLESGLRAALARKAELQDDDSDDSIYIVSRLINEGVTRMAYQIADLTGWQKIGIDSHRARQFELPPDVDLEIYKGHYFGEENEAFLRNVDIIVLIDPDLDERNQVVQKLAEKKGIPVIVPTEETK